VIERGVAAQSAEVFLDPVTRRADIGAGEKHHVAVRLVFQPRGGHDGIERPLGREFPANTAAGQDHVTSPRIDADPEDNLDAGAENVSAAENERDVEGVPAEVVPVDAVKAGLHLDSDEE
jgi:hypothetical protein